MHTFYEKIMRAVEVHNRSINKLKPFELIQKDYTDLLLGDNKWP